MLVANFKQRKGMNEKNEMECQTLRDFVKNFTSFLLIFLEICANVRYDGRKCYYPRLF